MLTAKIYAAEWEVEPKLMKEFGAKSSELLIVVDRVVGARADTVEDDPLSAAGQFAYIYGTRHTRGVFRPKGWVRFREENIEAVRNPASGRQIIYQSVDLAGSKRSPLAIRGKGSGARRQIDAAQGLLFTELPEAAPSFVGETPQVWYFCVSVNFNEAGEREVGAELSLPLPFKGDNFSGFLERIIIRKNGPWDRAYSADAPSDDAVEFEPKISRK